MVVGCALGIDVCHWMFKKKVNMVQGQQEGPLICHFMPVIQDTRYNMVLLPFHVYNYTRGWAMMLYSIIYSVYEMALSL